MDVGTAKLPVAERRGIPHHLLDLLDVTEPATVAEFQSLARAVVDDCRGRGVTPGAGRRLGALHPCRAGPASSSPAPTPTCGRGSRRSWPRSGPGPCTGGSRERRPGGGRADRARERPPRGPGPRGRGDHRPPVQRDRCPSRRTSIRGTVQVGVRIPRPVLDERIEQRVRRMWADGLVEEVRAPARRGPPRRSHGASGRSATSRCWRSSTASCTEERGPRAHRRRHPALRPAAGVVVRQGRADHLGGLGRPGRGSSRGRGARRG